MSEAVQPDQPEQPSERRRAAAVDEATEINPDVVIAPEDIGVPVVAEGEKLLEVDEVTLRFGGVVALNEVSFHINKGEILGLIGPNGAGKTTCFNVMTGVYQPTSGAVRYLGEPLGKRKKFEITKLRHRAHVPEHPALRQHDGARERPRRCRRAPHDRCRLGDVPPAEAPRARRRRATTGPWSC